MNYEQKYKEALERASHIKDNNTIATPQEVAEFLFPELKESEDERIKKEIIQSIQDNMCVIHKDKCIAWLEKQGKQILTWSEEDEKMLDSIIDCLDGLIFIDSDQINWLKSLKPNHWKPSEEQMSMLLAVLNDSNNITAESVHIALKSLYNDIKKL